MTLSNSKNFELNVTDYIEEAYERCGLELRTGYDLETAKRSMNLLLADWANRGLNQWTIQQTITTVSEGVNYISPGSDTIDVLDAVLSEMVIVAKGAVAERTSYPKFFACEMVELLNDDVSKNISFANMLALKPK